MLSISLSPYLPAAAAAAAIAAMQELGYDLSAHASKSLEEVKDHAPFDAVVTMGACVCGADKITNACTFMYVCVCVQEGWM